MLYSNVLPRSTIPVSIPREDLDEEMEKYISYQASIGCIADKPWAEEFVKGDYRLAAILQMEADKTRNANIDAAKKLKAKMKANKAKRGVA